MIRVEPGIELKKNDGLIYETVVRSQRVLVFRGCVFCGNVLYTAVYIENHKTRGDVCFIAHRVPQDFLSTIAAGRWHSGEA
jgi:hypothetical protein